MSYVETYETYVETRLYCPIYVLWIEPVAVS